MATANTLRRNTTTKGCRPAFIAARANTASPPNSAMAMVIQITATRGSLRPPAVAAVRRVNTGISLRAPPPRRADARLDQLFAKAQGLASPRASATPKQVYPICPTLAAKTCWSAFRLLPTGGVTERLRVVMASQPHPPQAQGIADDAHRRQRHGGSGDDRRQQDAEHRIQHACGNSTPAALWMKAKNRFWRILPMVAADRCRAAMPLRSP